VKKLLLPKVPRKKRPPHKRVQLHMRPPLLKAPLLRVLPPMHMRPSLLRERTPPPQHTQRK